MIVRGKSTIIDYHAPFDQGFTLFNHEVDTLASFLPDVNLNIISEEDFIFHLLDNESSFFITYDTASNKVIEVSLEAI